MVGGASSNVGHSVQYLIDWGDGTDSGWLPVGTTSAPKSWSTSNTYSIRAKARCATDPEVESEWTEPVNVMISETSYWGVTLLAPDGGGAIPSGSSYKIQWGAPPGADAFKVFYSSDSGLTWSKIAQDLTGTSYEWSVPIPWKNKKKCRIRVVGYNGTTKVSEDKSYPPFTIEVVRLRSLNGGEMLTSGERQTITWTTNQTKNPVHQVKLFYTLNAGVTWKRIVTLSGNAGTLNWRVPAVTTERTKCKLKVVLYDEDGNVVGSDVSDTFFTIQP
jgi:hypothetical protein